MFLHLLLRQSQVRMLEWLMPTMMAIFIHLMLNSTATLFLLTTPFLATDGMIIILIFLLHLCLYQTVWCLVAWQIPVEQTLCLLPILNFSIHMQIL